ncbi:MAG: copper amine oxidase N-terminal domain-containing protein [Candidatus Aquicultor sp.]
MKRIVKVALIVATISILLSGTAWASTPEITVKVNGVALSSEIPPLIVSSRTMVPMRTICESIGAGVTWDQRTKTVIVTKSGHIVKLQVGNRIPTKDNSPMKQLDVPAMLIEGRTLVPARFIAEAFGSTVDWLGATRTVDITYSDIRDGKTAQDILNESTATLDAVTSYKFSGTTKSTLIIFPDQAGSGPMAITQEITGAFRKPQEVYIKATTTASGGGDLFGLETSGADVSESYTNGSEYYEKVDGTWELVDAQTSSMLNSLIGGSALQNPSATLTGFKDVATIVAFGDDALVNGKPHYTIYIKLDSNEFKGYLLDLLTQLAGPDATPDDIALMKEMYGQLLEGMRFDMAYRVFVDKDTKIADYYETRSIFKLTMEGLGTVTAKADSSMGISDLYQPVVIPTVK